MEFVALDFETANADMSSICQLGLAHFKNGFIQEEWKTYIDPEDFFDEINVAIHGIDETTVKGAPTFPHISKRICSYLDNRIAVCHTHFDRVALNRACERYGVRAPTCTWLDSARVVRRTWEEFSCRGYGLKNVCASLGHEFKQHDALEDAKAAGYIMIAAIKKTGINIRDWLKRVERRIPFPESTADDYKIEQPGNTEGPLYGETLVFTGGLKISRPKASRMAAEIGCAVENGVNRRTTILVVGDQDARKLAGHEISGKHRKVEKMIAAGYQIRILRESDFEELVSLAQNKQTESL